MNILNVYLDETRQHLPLKNRADIVAEIRSVLMDMIEERNPNPGSALDEATIKAVLSEFGSPRKVARQYSNHQYLIGPQIFPVYLQVLKIVLLVVLIVVAVFNILGITIPIISGSAAGDGFFLTVLETVGGLFSSLFITFGAVTLSFSLIERFAPQEWQAEIEEDWSPDDLKQVEHVQRVSIPELAVEITLGIVFIILINVYLDRIGIFYLTEAGWVSAPILNDNVLRLIPWITAAAVLDIALNLYLIRKGIWDRASTFARVLINIFKIAVSTAIVVGPSIITIDPAAWTALNLDIGLTAQSFSQTMNTVLNVLLWLVIFGLVVDSIKRLVEIYTKKDETQVNINIG